MTPYHTLVADPPWPFNDKLPGKGRGAAKHYEVMTVEEIYAYSLDDVAEDARLFLWTVAAMPEEAASTMRARGYGMEILLGSSNFPVLLPASLTRSLNRQWRLGQMLRQSQLHGVGVECQHCVEP